MYQLSNYCFLGQNVPFSIYSEKMNFGLSKHFFLYSRYDAHSFGRRGHWGNTVGGKELLFLVLVNFSPVTLHACWDVKVGAFGVGSALAIWTEHVVLRCSGNPSLVIMPHVSGHTRDTLGHKLAPQLPEGCFLWPS